MSPKPFNHVEFNEKENKRIEDYVEEIKTTLRISQYLSGEDLFTSETLHSEICERMKSYIQEDKIKWNAHTIHYILCEKLGVALLKKLSEDGSYPQSNIIAKIAELGVKIEKKCTNDLYAIRLEKVFQQHKKNGIENVNYDALITALYYEQDTIIQEIRQNSYREKYIHECINILDKEINKTLATLNINTYYSYGNMLSTMSVFGNTLQHAESENIESELKDQTNEASNVHTPTL